MRCMEVEIKCLMCGKEYSNPIYEDNVSEEQRIKYFESKELVQDIFPCMDKSERESLISGMCSACQSVIFKK